MADAETPADPAAPGGAGELNQDPLSAALDPLPPAVAEFMAAGREESRLSVMFRTSLANRLGLAVNDMECLDFLSDVGSASAGQLAERTGLTTGAITSTIRRLQSAGYVHAERDPADRRRVIVSADQAAIAEGAQLYAPFGRAITELVANYTAEQLAFLTAHQRAMAEIYRDQLS